MKADMNSTKCFMALRPPVGCESALTLALSHRNGRGNFSIKEFYSYHRPLCGRGKGEGPAFGRTLISKERTEDTKKIFNRKEHKGRKL
jgi:hypothetical protein